MAPTGGGDAFEDLAVAGFVGQEGFGVGGGEVTGCDGVDLDSPGCPLVGEGLGELGYTALGRCVGGDTDAALEAEEGGDVDDLAGGAGARRMSRATSWESWKTLVRLTWRTCCQSSRVVSSAGARAMVPALLMRMSIWPKCWYRAASKRDCGTGGGGEVGLEGGWR